MLSAVAVCDIASCRIQLWVGKQLLLSLECYAQLLFGTVSSSVSYIPTQRLIFAPPLPPILTQAKGKLRLTMSFELEQRNTFFSKLHSKCIHAITTLLPAAMLSLIT